ncbi:hypothetical protein [Formosa algae]|nr:hypothetical protein [Formosa algae]
MPIVFHSISVKTQYYTSGTVTGTIYVAKDIGLLKEIKERIETYTF